MSRWAYIADNLQRVRERIARACARAGRDPDTVRLVAVSKNMPAEAVAAAYAYGVRDFGENRVEEALPKIAAVRELLGDAPAPAWHMIGHLQRRKVRDAMPAFDLVHSVDRLALAEEMEKRLSAIGKVMPVLLEIKLSHEETKWGFLPEEVPEAVGKILELPYLRIRGLMTMAPIVPHAEEARPYFRRLRELRDALARQFPQACWDELSMGMTDDFEPAVEEGATMVRIGRAVFLPAD
ncbi:MAG: YggS family pyridoxal phosphate-dependent enzyme [Anaerolineae bacterium]|nr:YggS family pyridoxal phosphate-dependent enzyme [Anaerolineae bacterium]